MVEEGYICRYLLCCGQVKHTHTHIHKLRVPKPAFTLICWWSVKMKTRKKKNKWKRGQQRKQNQSLTHKNCGVYVVWTHFLGVGQQCQNSYPKQIHHSNNVQYENQIVVVCCPCDCNGLTQHVSLVLGECCFCRRVCVFVNWRLWWIRKSESNF